MWDVIIDLYNSLINKREFSVYTSKYEHDEDRECFLDLSTFMQTYKTNNVQLKKLKKKHEQVLFKVSFGNIYSLTIRILGSVQLNSTCAQCGRSDVRTYKCSIIIFVCAQCYYKNKQSNSDTLHLATDA